ncbi:MAG: LLM class flavin-dependent oxidoreductase [Chloroflexi bacterium]|nr:LLM class flavin-dependent oxidoreductase [Chloroflexota bacterium]
MLPFHHPLRLAEETATLDILSGGNRLTVGLGRGNRPLEFYGHGVPQQESRSRMEEALDILLQAWTQDQVTFEGRHWKIQGVPVYPKPKTKPHPPIAFAVTSPESVRWAGNRGFPILTSGLGSSLPANLATRSSYETALRESGHSAAAITTLLDRWVVTKHVYVAPSDAEAHEEVKAPELWYRDSFARSMRAGQIKGLHPSIYEQSEQAIRRIEAQSWDELLREALLVGSPETVSAKIAELQEAGVAELACWTSFGGLPPEKVRRSMRLFATEVAPRFQ